MRSDVRTCGTWIDVESLTWLNSSFGSSGLHFVAAMRFVLRVFGVFGHGRVLTLYYDEGLQIGSATRFTASQVSSMSVAM